MFGCSFWDLPSRCDSNSLAVSVSAQSPNSSHGCPPEQMAWWSRSQLGTPLTQCGDPCQPHSVPKCPADHVLLSPGASGSPRTPGICPIHCCSLWGTSCTTPRTRGRRLGTPGPLGLLFTQDTIRAPIFRVLLPVRRCRGLWDPRGSCACLPLLPGYAHIRAECNIPSWWPESDTVARTTCLSWTLQPTG